MTRMLLKVSSPAVNPEVPSYFLSHWPPSADAPISVGSNGSVVSRFSDPSWDLSSYAGTRKILRFAIRRKGGPDLSSENEQILRLVAAWWLFGERPLQTAASVVSFASRIRPVFRICTEAGIAATELWRYPHLIEKIPDRVAPSCQENVLQLLHDLFVWRDRIGFTILDESGLRSFGAKLKRHTKRQTAYIPPRIWKHQLDRLRTFLDDYNDHEEGIEACFHYCLEAYSGPGGHQARRAPFTKDNGKFGRYGSFASAAAKFGIDGLLARWCLPPGDVLREGHRVSMLSSYFSRVGFAGTAYILNLTGMRIDECMRLRTSCLEVEEDPQFGKIYLIRGRTTKTVSDPAAAWVTSPSVVSAVRAMSSVAKLRVAAAMTNPNVEMTKTQRDDPLLRLKAYEPWSTSLSLDAPADYRLHFTGYCAWRRYFANLFDETALTITEDDLSVARMITPTLDDSKFAVGKAWPLAWHQLRRTVAVNMTGSGLVSDSTLQYQLKHLSRAMSLYYGQGYSRLTLSHEMRNEYVRTVYEMLARELCNLRDDRFVSPLGTSHKENKLRILGTKDRKELVGLAKAGKIAYRETLLGGCMKPGDCPYGGIENLIHCGGGLTGKPCPDALFDGERRAAMEQLRLSTTVQLADAPSGSRLRSSLEAQIRSIERALATLETD